MTIFLSFKNFQIKTLFFHPFLGAFNNDCFCFCHAYCNTLFWLLSIEKFTLRNCQFRSHCCSNRIRVHEKIIPVSFIIISFEEFINFLFFILWFSIFPLLFVDSHSFVVAFFSFTFWFLFFNFNIQIISNFIFIPRVHIIIQISPISFLTFSILITLSLRLLLSRQNVDFPALEESFIKLSESADCPFGVFKISKSIACSCSSFS